jgi:ABC transport system ATP-binding/permease protein
VVSHDREFLNNVATAMLVFEGHGVFKEYIGGYDDWERQAPLPQKEPATAAPGKKITVQVALRPGQKKLSYKEQQELKVLPEKIEKLEQERETLNEQMADPAWYARSGFVSQAKARCAIIDRELAAGYQRWEELDARPQ